MPTYGIKRKSTEEEWEVICSWNELQKILKKMKILYRRYLLRPLRVRLCPTYVQRVTTGKIF